MLGLFLFALGLSSVSDAKSTRYRCVAQCGSGSESFIGSARVALSEFPGCQSSAVQINVTNDPNLKIGRGIIALEPPDKKLGATFSKAEAGAVPTELKMDGYSVSCQPFEVDILPEKNFEASCTLSCGKAFKQFKLVAGGKVDLTLSKAEGCDRDISVSAADNSLLGMSTINLTEGNEPKPFNTEMFNRTSWRDLGGKFYKKKGITLRCEDGFAVPQVESSINKPQKPVGIQGADWESPNRIKPEFPKDTAVDEKNKVEKTDDTEVVGGQ